MITALLVIACLVSFPVAALSLSTAGISAWILCQKISTAWDQYQNGRSTDDMLNEWKYQRSSLQSLVTTMAYLGIFSLFAYVFCSAFYALLVV